MHEEPTIIAKQPKSTRKRGNCECITTWGCPSHASPFPL